MTELINLPLDDEIIESYGNIEGLNNLLLETNVDSIEWIWGGRDFCSQIPKNMSQGYHLTFYSDWLDFYLDDKDALLKKFKNYEVVKQIYGKTSPDILLTNYKEDLERAVKLGAKYVVFHMGDVSIEEGYSYKFEHSDRLVIDSAIEIINRLLHKFDHSMDFLIENLWWAGFRFTEQKTTAYILDNIEYKNKGIMLDTGHLLNTNIFIQNEDDAIDYIREALISHSDMLHFVKGIHLNKSLSGKYVQEILRQNLQPVGKDYFERFANSYSHILNIDRHEPFESVRISEIVNLISPKYLVHELSGKTLLEKINAIKTQRRALYNGKQL